MLTKLKGLSTRAKAALGSGLALLIAAGVGLGVWQPWNQTEPPPEDPVDQVQPAPAPQPPAEKQLSVKVGSEDVPCTLYEGDGWSICVPDGWTVSATPDGIAMNDGATVLEVARERQAGYDGAFVTAWAGENGGKALTFYASEGTDGGWSVTFGPADGEGWRKYEKLAAALARTLKTGDKEPFADSFVLPAEPDWQEAEGLTVLFLDKDGYVLDDKVQSAVESYMLSWSDELKAAHTGQYRVNGISWHSTFTGLRDGYIDVFRASVSYEQTGGSWTLPTEGVLAAVYHDGGSVEKTKWLDESVVRSLPELAAQLKG